jgi:hypothetical protein
MAGNKKISVEDLMDDFDSDEAVDLVDDLGSDEYGDYRVDCPACGSSVYAEKPTERRVDTRCKNCNVRLRLWRIGYTTRRQTGEVNILGPKGEPLSKAESLDISDDRLCSRCKYHLRSSRRTMYFWIRWTIILGVLYAGGVFIGWDGFWKGGGALIVLVPVFLVVLFYRFMLEDGFESLCRSEDAQSVAGDNDPEYINSNLRCKFWEQKGK